MRSAAACSPSSRIAGRAPNQPWTGNIRLAADREIDDYVRHALQYGILQKSDFPARTYPDFARTFADVQQLGNGCTAPGR